MLGFIFWRIKLSKEPDFLNFVKYFIATAKNPMGYCFTKEFDYDLTKAIFRIGSSGRITFVVDSSQKDFKSLCKRNGISLDANKVAVKTEFVSVDLLNLYRLYKKGEFKNIDLNDYDSSSKLVIYNNESINTFNVLKVRKIM